MACHHSDSLGFPNFIRNKAVHVPNCSSTPSFSCKHSKILNIHQIELDLS